MKCYNCGSKQVIVDVEADSYVCEKCGFTYPKQYFFISHSHKDIEKVRIIRNIIEETFFYEPILFFLKCVSDEEELNNLLKREIYERIWFVYCESANARNSKYVTFERDYIDYLISQGKIINKISIDLDLYDVSSDVDLDKLAAYVHKALRSTKIFISYSRYDDKEARLIKDALIKRDFSVWTADNIRLGHLWNEEIKDAIKEHTCNNGIIMLLISKESINSNYIQNEIKQSQMNNAYVVPVILAEGNNEDYLFYELGKCNLMERQSIIIHKENIKNDVEDLANKILMLNK